MRVRAQEHGIPVLTPRTPRDPQFQEQLRALAPDCAPVVAYGALVPRTALDIPRFGWVNLHFSLLPAWRGAAPVQHAIRSGDEVTGATTFLLEEGLDTGPIYGVMTETIRPTDTSGDLLGRLALAGAGLLVATLDGIESGDLVAKTQPAEGISHAPKVEVDDARVDWMMPALAIDRLIRSCTPPVTPVAAESVSALLTPGELLVTKAALYAGTATSPVRLGLVRAHGKKEMAAADWARGVRIEPGERLGEDG